MITLKDLLVDAPAEAKVAVTKVRDRTKAVIRDAMRAECRLSMMGVRDQYGTPTAVGHVPIHVRDGYPAGVETVALPDDARRLIAVAAYAGSVRAARGSVDDLTALHLALTRLTGNSPPNLASPNSIVELREWTDTLLQALERDNPIAKILAVDEDVLGVYACESGVEDDTVANGAEISLYWAPISLVARSLGESVENVTVVVLAHEMAHAYTQLGADIEGRRWPTASFLRADRALVEALAQYYTSRCLLRLRDRLPGAIRAFEALLKLQNPIYRGHEEWEQNASPEAVRWAMLEARRQAIDDMANFVERLQEATVRCPPLPDLPKQA